VDFGKELKPLLENFDHPFTTRSCKGTLLSADWVLPDCSDILQLSLFPAPAMYGPPPEVDFLEYSVNLGSTRTSNPAPI